MRKHIKFIIPIVSLVLLVSLGIQLTRTSSALSGSNFKSGNIISDTLFYNGNTMSTSQIQSFFNSKVPNCDKNGTKSHGGTSRANYGSARGYPPPYTCLKKKTSNTPNKGANAYCKAYPGGHKKAAKTINDVAKACGISEKVLIVLLEKEQSLVTDDWPWKIQYKKAMGYGCPDTDLPSNVDSNNNGCYDQYEGFFNQVYHAAKQFKRYKKDGHLFNYRSGRTSYVQWHPNAGCGGSNVTMQNNATAGLYNYTPYRPNTAALNNLYGTGNSCSSYGNRNFWRLYSDWFGSTHPKCTKNDSAGSNVYRLFSTKRANHFYTAMECEANVFDTRTSYKVEGITFKQAPKEHDGRTGIYRLKKKSSRNYFWTSSIKERKKLVNNHRYKLEGTAYIGYTKNSTAPKDPVYRLYNSKTGGHLWTPSANERDNVDSKSSWRYEGVAYYVYKP